MQRTINEIYELIKQKKENALIDLKLNERNPLKSFNLQGEIDAYTDIICLIESSGLINQDKTKS